MDVTKFEEKGAAREKRKMKNGNKTEELEIKLPIGQGFKLSFLSIFHFTVARACSPHPVPRFSNIRFIANAFFCQKF